MSEHGTLGRYNNEGCRCNDCRAAWNHYQSIYQQRWRIANPGRARERERAARRRRRERVAAGDPAIRHGTLTAYQGGCRCEPCRGAMRNWRARNKAERAEAERRRRSR